METNRIDPDREYTGKDLLTAGFGIAMGGLIIAGVAYSFATKGNTLDLHAAWFFGVTSVFIFVIGIGTFIHGLKKNSNSDSPGSSPVASGRPSGSENTNA